MSAVEQLFDLPVVHEPLEPETPLPAVTAETMKQALRRRHPGETRGAMVGQWTCIEEWLGIDLLALNAWQKADVIGYEIKISRSDLRRELLKPHKRSRARAVTTEFYLAVPAGLLSDDEIAYEEPEWEDDDFRREPCPGVPAFGPELGRRPGMGRRYGGRCSKWNRRGRYSVRVPVPTIKREHVWTSEDGSERVTCWTCGGKGYLDKSRVERDAPTCWVPRDVGLVTISSRGCRIVKRSPKRKDPKPIASTRKQLNDLVRWVSHRPDPRHREGS